MSDLGVYPNKYFDKDIRVFRKKLKDKEVFTFSKFADGGLFDIPTPSVTFFNLDFLVFRLRWVGVNS